MLYGMKPNYNPQTPGVVFKIAKDGTDYAVLHDFSPFFHFGLYTESTGPLVEGGDGFLYGVGAQDTTPFPFRMNKFGELYQTGQTFSSEVTGLTKGNDGSIYGIASIGQLFKLDTAFGGLGVTTLPTPTFTDGVSGLVPLPSGEFCGTSPRGGDRNMGSVFKLTPPAQ